MSKASRKASRARRRKLKRVESQEERLEMLAKRAIVQGRRVDAFRYLGQLRALKIGKQAMPPGFDNDDFDKLFEE